MAEPIERPRFPLAAKVLIGALAVFGALAVVQWVIGALFGLLRLLLVVAVVGSIAALAFWGLTGRGDD